MTFNPLNTRRLLLYALLISAFCFASCTTGKKATVPAPPVAVNVPDSIETYNCGFERGSFSGQLPCFGDECNDSGAPLTMITFNTKHMASKKLKMDTQLMKNISGQWSINAECVIEIHYEDGTSEYYKFHEGINKLERLTPAQQSFPGTLNKHNYLSKSI